MELCHLSLVGSYIFHLQRYGCEDSTLTLVEEHASAVELSTKIDPTFNLAIDVTSAPGACGGLDAWPKLRRVPTV